jgi:hypothetical protein
VGALVLLLAAGDPARGEDPAAEVTRAIQSLGPPGTLWGRFAVEEESPEGPWTPLAGVEVTLYPATPALLAELERTRQQARASGAQYEATAARLLAILAAHQARVDAQSAGTPLARLVEPIATPPPEETPPPAAATPLPAAKKRAASKRPASEGEGAAADAPAPPKPGRHPFQQVTDPGGLFAFTGVPAGDWVVIGVRTGAYAGQRLRAEARPRSPSMSQRFTARETGGAAKEAEIWLGRVRLGPHERGALAFTDRARWFVGPLR